MTRSVPLRWLKPAILTGGLVPLAALALRAWRGELGANPIAEVMNALGLMALVFLVASLACTPLRARFGWTWPIRVRRLLGLMAFTYATIHVATYAGLDQLGDWRAITADVLKRRFIFVGFAAYVLLVPLAITSTAGWVRRLGFVRWKRLHRLVYLAAGLGVIHFVWRVKADLREPLVYVAVLGVLLLGRVPRLRGERSRPTREVSRPMV